MNMRTLPLSNEKLNEGILKLAQWDTVKTNTQTHTHTHTLLCF